MDKYTLAFFAHFFFLSLFNNYAAAQVDTILIDFGKSQSVSDFPYNNMTQPYDGAINGLVNQWGISSGFNISVYDSFRESNGSGTTMPEPSLGISPTATSDSFFGNTVEFNGGIDSTGGVELTNLESDKEYSITLFGSRIASDNRQTQFVIEGETVDTQFLQVSSNTMDVVESVMYPTSDGKIRIAVSPGPENDNEYGFFYLGFMRLVYEPSEPPSLFLNLISPNGGEYWQAGKSPNIEWKGNFSGEGIIQYSINNGMDWTTIDTIAISDKKYTWTVPNSPSEDCLVRILSDTVVGASEGVFTIGDDDSVCRIVVLGSSTAAGSGASPVDSSWVYRFRYSIFQKNTRFAVVNLAQGGYTTYHILPTGTPIPSNINITPNPFKNMTQALALEPYAIIINMPSNDAANFFPVENQLDNFDLLYSKATEAGVKTYICTTQPRNFNNMAQVEIQVQTKDSIMEIYGVNAIDFWNGIATADGWIDPAFDSGDGVHLNNAGHLLLSQKVLAKEIGAEDCAPETVSNTYYYENELEIKAYPNPFSEVLNVELNFPGDTDFDIYIYDSVGRLWAEKTDLKSMDGNQTVTFDFSGKPGPSGQLLYCHVLLKNKKENNRRTFAVWKTR